VQIGHVGTKRNPVCGVKEQASEAPAPRPQPFLRHSLISSLSAGPGGEGKAPADWQLCVFSKEVEKRNKKAVWVSPSQFLQNFGSTVPA
jgi:hypothetical protein